MWIKILNKNLIDQSGEYILDNMKSFEVDEGAVITENFNETLDSATITISNVIGEIEIEPLDKVILHDNRLGNSLGYIFMCVDTFTATQTCLNPAIYRYEISLFSETKLLEGVPLPNLAITENRDSSLTTVYQIMEKYLSDYSPKERMREPDHPQGFNNVQMSFSNTQVESGYKYYAESQTLWVERTRLQEITGLEVTTSTFSQSFLEDEEIHFTYTYEFEDEWFFLKIIGTGGTIHSEPITDTVTGRISGNISVTSTPAFTPKYRLGSDIFNNTPASTKFNISCPEFQWNQPTLREVLNDLMMVADCIPTVQNGVINFIDISKKRNAVNTSHINYISNSQSSSDYVSALRMELKNVMQSSVSNVDNAVNVCEYLPFTCSGSILTTDNLILKTSKPILRLKSLYLCLPCKYKKPNDASFYYCYGEANIVDFVLEYEKYKVLSIYYNPPYVPSVWQSTRYQNNTLYYTRGGNTIENFSYLIKRGTLPSEVPLIRVLVKDVGDAIVRNVPGIPDYSVYQLPADDYYRKCMFRIEYETQGECLFEAGKDKVVNKRVIIDNQTNSYIDAYNQGFLEYQKANRLGNKQYQISAKYESNYNNIIKIGDYLDTRILYSVQYKIYKNYIDVYSQGVEDYILRDYFTGVKAKVRSWKIVSGNEALVRHDLEKIYCEFSFSKKRELDTNCYFDCEYFLSPFTSETTKPLDYIIYTYKSTSESYDSGYYVLDLSKRLVGNSIIFSYSLNDNYYLATYLENNGDYDGTLGGVKIGHYKYTNDSGINFGSEIYLHNEINSGDGQLTWPTQLSDIDSSLYDNLIKVSARKPKFNTDITTGNKFDLELSYYKDSREISAQSIQFEFCSDTKDIVFTKKFLEKQECIRTSALDNNLKIYIGNSSNYDWKNPVRPSVPVSDRTLTITSIDDFTAQLTISGSLEQNKAYYICDGDNNLLLVINNSLSCYFNILKDRDCNIYDGSYGAIIGTIIED